MMLLTPGPLWQRAMDTAYRTETVFVCTAALGREQVGQDHAISTRHPAASAPRRAHPALRPGNCDQGSVIDNGWRHPGKLDALRVGPQKRPGAYLPRRQGVRGAGLRHGPLRVQPVTEVRAPPAPDGDGALPPAGFGGGGAAVPPVRGGVRDGESTAAVLQRPLSLAGVRGTREGDAAGRARGGERPAGGLSPATDAAPAARVPRREPVC
jgi:hypothetical protein